MGATALSYPKCAGEYETIRAVSKGRSLARLGDGEIKIAFGHGYSREPRNPKLTAEIRSVLFHPNEGCLVGIPTMDPEGVRYWNWKRHLDRYAGLLESS